MPKKYAPDVEQIQPGQLLVVAGCYDVTGAGVRRWVATYEYPLDGPRYCGEPRTGDLLDAEKAYRIISPGEEVLVEKTDHQGYNKTLWIVQNAGGLAVYRRP